MAWVKLGSGTLNKSKQDGKGAPYYGKCVLNIDGRDREIQIGAWVKDGNNGSKFFSLAFSVQEDAQQQAPASKSAPADEEIPF